MSHVEELVGYGAPDCDRWDDHPHALVRVDADIITWLCVNDEGRILEEPFVRTERCAAGGAFHEYDAALHPEGTPFTADSRCSRCNARRGNGNVPWMVLNVDRVGPQPS